MHLQGHGQNKLHLDRLKPSTVLFMHEWKVKVVDFGLGSPQYYVKNPKVVFDSSINFMVCNVVLLQRLIYEPWSISGTEGPKEKGPYST